MINQIAPDKWRHFFVGILIGCILEALFCWIWPGHLALVTGLVFLIIAFISYGFELFSKLSGKGRYDFMDAVASVIGGVIGIGIILSLIVIL